MQSNRKLSLLIIVVGIMLATSSLVYLVINNSNKYAYYCIFLGLWYILIGLTFKYKK